METEAPRPLLTLDISRPLGLHEDFEPCASELDRLKASIRYSPGLSLHPLPVDYPVPTPVDHQKEKREAAIAAAIAALDRLPCAAAFSGDRALTNHLKLWSWTDTDYLTADLDLLRETPQLEYIFLFHGNGRLREAALNKLQDPARSAFFICALAWRLNDWAEPVRGAAARCVERVTPATPPDLLAEAAIALLVRMDSWARWGCKADVLEKALSRPDVADALSKQLSSITEGRGGAVLRQALRWATLDRHLPELARNARLPSVRAVALQTLLNGAAKWPTGWAWEWIDKSYGLRRRVRVIESRALAEGPDPLVLIGEALSDRSATIRRIASQALVPRRFGEAEVGRLAALFAADRNRRVREPAEFVLKERVRAGIAARPPARSA